VPPCGTVPPQTFAPLRRGSFRCAEHVREVEDDRRAQGFARTTVMECAGSLRLDAREFDDLGPLLGFVGDEGPPRRRARAESVAAGLLISR
jgi:hypothetical protein